MGRFKMTNQNEVHLPNVSSEAFQEILSFIYSGQVNIHGDTVMELYHAAEYMHYEHIKDCCIDFICKDIRFNNFHDYLKFADQYRISAVRQIIVNFMLDNFELLTKRSSFYNIHLDTLHDVLLSDNLKCTSEKSVVECVVQLLKCKPQYEDDYPSKLKVVDTVRYGILPDVDDLDLLYPYVEMEWITKMKDQVSFYSKSGFSSSQCLSSRYFNPRDASQALVRTCDAIMEEDEYDTDTLFILPMDIDCMTNGKSTHSVGTMTTDCGNNTTNIKSMTTNIGMMSINIGAMTTNIGSVAAEIGTMTNNIGSMTNEIGTMTNNIGSITTEIGTMTTNFIEMATTVGTMTANATTTDKGTNVRALTNEVGTMTSNTKISNISNTGTIPPNIGVMTNNNAIDKNSISMISGSSQDEMIALTIGNFILMMSESSSVKRYDWVRNEWFHLSNMPDKLDFPIAILCDKSIMVIGANSEHQIGPMSSHVKLDFKVPLYSCFKFG